MHKLKRYGFAGIWTRSLQICYKWKLILTTVPRTQRHNWIRLTMDTQEIYRNICNSSFCLAERSTCEARAHTRQIYEPY